MATAQTTKATRHTHDFYPTPSFFTNLLLSKVPIAGGVGEPFVGNGAIAQVIDDHSDRVWCAWTNDIVEYSGWKPASLLDLSTKENWEFVPVLDWYVTNPPFNLMNDPWYLNALYEKCRVGLALLVRQTWMTAGSGQSGVSDRGLWLEEHPPTKQIVLPRYCWADNKTTGKPQVDACAHYWVIWHKQGWRPEVAIEVVTGRNIPGWQQRTSSLIEV